MSIGTILYNLIIGPLELFFEILFSIANRVIQNPGLSIIFLSLAMNFLVLPLYKRADALQEEERQTEAKLRPWITHIKKTFKGDERFMMLQTYYRQNNYKQTDILKGSVSLLLEIPFFIAAYNFLSGLELLNGVAFGPIANLGAPDGMLVVGGHSINVLPILMTLINLVSSAIYTKGLSVKSKIQLYGMAAIFLVLLYQSPAGLVFYWTLNNLFSLVKNVFYKLKNLKFVFHMKSSVAEATITKKDHITFWAGCVFITVLTGLLIPSTVINTSPEEFINTVTHTSPLIYILSSFLTAAGTFIIWFGIFYMLANATGKKIMELLMCVFCGAAAVDYMFFGKNYGTMSPQLIFDKIPVTEMKEQLINLTVLIIVVAVIFFICLKKKEMVRLALFATILAGIGMSAMNINHIHSVVTVKSGQLQTSKADIPKIQLSRKGKNVIVLMMDRAIGSYVPYIFNEHPELKEQFEGFTYYPNTLSFGGHTNFGSPALFGGYEYTPEEMNKRGKEPLENKHNEALKVMPLLFSEAGYEITICDPPYAGYDWIPDLTIFDEYPEMHTYNTMGKFVINSKEKELDKVKKLQRNLYCFSLFKIAPDIFKRYVYDGGKYNNIESYLEEIKDVQHRNGISRAEGVAPDFLRAYSTLQNMEEMTDIRDRDTGSFLMLTNDTTHAPTLLQEPEYIPVNKIDNTEYDQKHPDRKDENGNAIQLNLENQMMHYHVNTAAYIQLGNWFEFLKETGIYDNSRIIIVSDHGYGLQQYEDLIYGSDELDDFMFYNPLLMVKDFGSKEFKTDYTFMTNADTPTLAFTKLIENPVNPFTGKEIDNRDKFNKKQKVITSHTWDVITNNGTKFLPADWYSVHDNVMDRSNWEKLDKKQ